ncbi:MAG: hypothetical protein WDO15_08530, partial [Bacteroidota bacterium]
MLVGTFIDIPRPLLRTIQLTAKCFIIEPGRNGNEMKLRSLTKYILLPSLEIEGLDSSASEFTSAPRFLAAVHFAVLEEAHI